MEVRNDRVDTPFFSICIPQYNRTSFLLEALKGLNQQTFKDFEICISDDQSNDGREDELIQYLQESELSFVYKRQDKNQRYDGNLRSSITLARGKYCFLHANDDCLTLPTTLQDLYEEMQKHERVDVVVGNFEDWTTGEKTRRIRRSRLVGSGAEVAATRFRNLAFVSGIVMDRAKAQSYTTDKWDGSEMYQMYLFAKMIGSGGSLLELDTSIVRKDLQVPGELVDHVTRWEKVHPCPIIERKRPMLLIGRVVADGIAPYLTDVDRHRVNEKIFLQLYSFTYAFWIFNYRRLQSWNYAAGIGIGMKPKNVFLGIELGVFRTARLYALYLTMYTLGLVIPVFIFERLTPLLYSIAKSVLSSVKTSKAAALET
jgi:glycosyltransferase involved in cell wall biosynthesis